MLRVILLGFILLIFLGHIQLIETAQAVHNKFVDYYVSNVALGSALANPVEKKFYQKELTIERISRWERIKKQRRESLFEWLTTEVMLSNSWEYYKKVFISDDGRVIDHQRGSVTTSEGQAYAIRRAQIMRDRATFDKTYNWTKYNLKRSFDNLFAWLWGQRVTGKEGNRDYGILDDNVASDACVDIASALVYEAKFCNETLYRTEAQKILNDIWNKETVVIKGERILTAGIKQQDKENIEINPSYFQIYSFRVFAEVDKTHNWQELVNSSYRLINYCVDNIPSGLPPDVFYINKNTGEITFDKVKSDFSYDAIRVFGRVYIDHTLTKDKRGEKLLSKSKFFINNWKRDHKFYTAYKQNGEVKYYDEAICAIAILLPVIKLYDKKVAADVYKERIKSVYHKEGCWNNPLDYYAQNLVWFGTWLYQDEENLILFKY